MIVPEGGAVRDSRNICVCRPAPADPGRQTCSPGESAFLGSVPDHMVEWRMLMTSKEMEARSGVARANIRYYEAEGLLLSLIHI